MSPTLIQSIAAVVFAIALIHTFSTKFFERLAHKHPEHEGVFHLLSEVEVVFGFWAMVLVTLYFMANGSHDAIEYVESRNFTEPMFVFAIMIVAGSRPILELATKLVSMVARLIRVGRVHSFFFTVLCVVPLLGSFITEPAAMTLAAMMLRDRFNSESVTQRMRYATIGVLFVNISIGGVLTPFAAPPVLMVAAKWGWDMPFMLQNFGWKAVIAVFINASVLSYAFRNQLKRVELIENQNETSMPFWMIGLASGILFGVVVFAHHPPLFLGFLLLFMGVATAYQKQFGRLIVREGLLVAFFLAGLVVLGGMQQWWLKPLLLSMSPEAVFFGATGLTAITDNAALTYLGSLVEGLSDEFKYMLVAGAVTGGGLTVIANAPNPAGFSILKVRFEGGVINPLSLTLAAIPPTCVAIVCFFFL